MSETPDPHSAEQSNEQPEVPMKHIVRIAQIILIEEGIEDNVCVGFAEDEVSDTDDKVRHYIRYDMRISDPEKMDRIIAHAKQVIDAGGGVMAFLDKQTALREQEKVQRDEPGEQTEPQEQQGGAPAEEALDAQVQEIQEAKGIGRLALRRLLGRGKK